MQQSEYKVQAAIFKHHQSAFPFIKFVFIPNASKDAATGFFNKQLGLHPGAFDIHLFYNRNCITDHPSHLRVGIFEAKSGGGRITSNQNKYASEMQALGAYTGHGSTVKSYHDCLVRWGITPLHNAVKEPDLRSWEDKKKDGWNVYAPEDMKKP